jgi:hypothetical protein
MARSIELRSRASAHVATRRDRDVVLRLADPVSTSLRSTVFSRYPELEWASFAWFGWRECNNVLILTLAELELPRAGDLDESVAHVAIDEQYSLRVALSSERTQLAPGIIHSHPEGYQPIASTIDDDMDTYYNGYFEDFAPNRPYVSLIFSKLDGQFVCSGRVRWRNDWWQVTRTVDEGRSIPTWSEFRPTHSAERKTSQRTERLRSAFGQDAEERLSNATVAVVGAGGTGSAAIEVLARAGVGRLVLVDPDFVEESNLERIHGSSFDAIGNAKVSVARDHVLSVQPTCDVIAIQGALPQDLTIDAVVQANALVCCTDSQSSRLAVSDIAMRYLIPALDCAVTLEGAAGRVTGQIIQLVRFLPADPCVLCQGMTIPWRVAQELMSEAEKLRRRAAAEEALARGDVEIATRYWRHVPQLNTVGYLTTAAGALAAGYVIGWLTNRFAPPFARLQMNLAAPFLDVTDLEQTPDSGCACRRVRGHADQAAADAYVSTPVHWPHAQQL